MSSKSKENVHPNAKSEPQYNKINSTVQASAKLSTKESTAGKIIEPISEESYRDDASVPPQTQEKPLFVMGKTKSPICGNPNLFGRPNTKELTPLLTRPGDRYIPMRNRSFD